MGTFIEGLGQQVASQGAGGILGMLTAGWNDERQLRQQHELMRMQIAGSKEMTDYEWKKQLEMWNATSYPAELAMMKKAGLSPGLMYKGSGPGGTTGSAGGTVTGGMAPSGGGEIIGMMQMGMQSQLNQANIELMKSQAEKNRVEAEKIGGVDTGLVRTSIMEKMAGIDNVRAQTTGQNIENEIKSLEQRLKNETLDDAIELVGWSLNKMQNEVEGLYQDNIVKKAVSKDLIDTVKAELTRIMVDTGLKQAGITKTEQETKAIAEQLQQGWQKVEIDRTNASTAQRAQALQEWLHDVSESTKMPIDIIEKIGQAIFLRNIFSQPGQAPIRGFHQR